MPRVEFVNLSLNRLCGPVEPSPEVLGRNGMGHIKSLVLNNTRLDWESVETIIKLLPALEELHLSLNDYRNVLIDTIDDFSELLMDVDGDEDLEVPDEDICMCQKEKKSTKRSELYMPELFAILGQYLNAFYLQATQLRLRIKKPTLMKVSVNFILPEIQCPSGAKYVDSDESSRNSSRWCLLNVL